MVKVISLSNEAYSILKKSKKIDESFSDVVIRLSKKKERMDIKNVFGVWKGDKEIEKIFNKLLNERHEYKPVSI